ncbi:MAG: CusA/CzcA family heavy metal efflux RND transporter [Gammaproteobacteria bacterium]|nr:MAG: CusA/CzcA family heavy metal efflux RND transporter [Gammaproteobacteria bacterium]RLA36252.1 MAG: CusA/CzcA family heavy metal efflux RND transporter [Gammaproteobacteria bacterium]
MSKLIQFALTQRVLIMLATMLLAGFGYYAFKQLPIDAFPDVSPTQVKIIVKAPGMTPEEVENQITAPIELELLGIPKQVMLRSIAKYALSDITVDFAEGTDIYWARQQVAERLSAAWDNLPTDIEGGIAPMTTPLGEMFMFTVEGDISLTERRTILDWIIRPALRTVPGVADVNSLGGYVRSFEVMPDPYRMAARGVNPLLLGEALAANNRNDGAGRMSEGEEALLVRSEGRIKTLDDVRQIVVRVEKGTPIRVSDVATVKIGAITRYGAVTQDGESEAVEGLVLGLRGANAREVVAGVRQKLDDIATALPQGVTIDVFYDRGDLVNRAVSTVAKALAEATILVVILLVLFLGDLRASLSVAMVLPLAALATFILMRQFGMSANLMSLGGLAIAIGMLVDAAVVIVENITTHLSEWQKDKRLPRLHIIYRAVREVSVPVASGIGIIIIVFFPLLTLQGLEGKLFTPVALTIVFALAASLVLSLTMIPVLSSFLLTRVSHEEPWLPRKLQALYIPALRWCLDHTKWMAIGAIASLVLTAGVYLLIGKSFMPTMDEGDIIVQLEKLPSITLDKSIDLDLRVQKAILAQVPEVDRIVARVGSDEIGMDPMGLNETDIFMVLQPKSEWRMDSKEELIEEIRVVLEKFPGIAYGFTQPIEMRVSEMLTGVRGDVAVKLFGPELDSLNQYAAEIADVLRTVPGSEDVFASQNDGVQYYELDIDRLAAGRLGMDVLSIQRILRTQLEGLQLGIVQEGSRRTPLLMRADATVGASPATFSTMPIALAGGISVPLGSLAKIRHVEGVVAVARERGQRYTVVRTNVAGRDLVGFVEEARSAVSSAIDLPAGYYVEWGGQFENQQRAAARLALVVPVSIGLIFLLLFSTFGSVRQALLVLTNIPFALIGGVFALWLTGEYLSVPASVGFIALLGIAVLNGVVMVSYFNQLKARGLSMSELVIQGAKRRLRPVLMTASIAAFGLVPLLFASGPGSEIQRPLAIVVIGGLITATLLTLFILPILYRRFGGGETVA